MKKSTRFSVIYADPPWKYSDASRHRGGAARHYQTLSLRQIRDVPIGRIAADDSVLFLWITAPMLALGWHALVATSWGFAPKTCAFTWVKTTSTGGLAVGMGHYTRSNPEFCMLATRGRLARESKSVHSVIMAPRGEHSAKPPEARNRIVELYGDVPRIELFAREQIEGWRAWGHEVPR